MTINLNTIPDHGLDLNGEISSDVLGIDDITAQGPIRCSFHLSNQDDAVLLRGEITLKASTSCARCLDTIPLTIHIPDFVSLLEKNSQPEIDLAPIVREEIILVMPHYAKCQLDQDGNCPYSGKNWSRLDEDSIPPPLSDPWSALDKFKKT